MTEEDAQKLKECKKIYQNNRNCFRENLYSVKNE